MTRPQRHSPMTTVRLASGFSLVELVMVLVVVGVLAVVVIPHFTGTTGYQARGYFESLLSASRYGQKLAVASNCKVQLQISGGNTYKLTQASQATCKSTTPAFTTSVINPAEGGSFQGTAPSGITITPANATVVFDGSGQASASTDLAVNPGGYKLHIYSTTGFVERQ